MSSLKQKTYMVKGMHCASCELIIEKKLLTIPHVKTADASTSEGSLSITYENAAPNIDELNKFFKEENYRFSENEKSEIQEKKSFREYVYAGIIAAGIILIIYLLTRTGIMGSINVKTTSSLPAFFGLGLIAGISTCAALVGGLVLSLSKQWFEVYPGNKLSQKLAPHLLFNIGRLFSYALIGVILGLIGKKIQLSLTFSSFLTIAVSLIMIALGLQMLNVKYFRGFKLSLPKKLTRKIADEKKYSNKMFPLLLGGLTIFLPCGFTITAEGLALISGSAVRGGLIMLAFALGTAPALFLIGLSSVKIFASRWARQFSLTAGILILFLGLYNINSQIKVITGNDFVFAANKTNGSGYNPTLTNGKQLIKMQASSYKYTPNYFKLKKGVPVRWEITDVGTSGCTNAVLARALFPDVIQLTPGKTSIKEFTPEKTGRFKFSCWMGMVSGVFEVVE